MSSSARFVQSPDGSLAPNPSVLVFMKQDQFLASWLLSTISSSLLTSFTDAKTACDVWTTATSLFAADTGTTQSRIRHELHSLKEGMLSIKDYVSRIKNLGALLETSGTPILEAEKTEIMLAGLPPEFDTIVSSVSVSFDLVPFQKLVDALVEYENRQLRAVQEVYLHANLVERTPSQNLEGSVRSVCPLFGGHGRGFRPRVQCQICNRVGQLAQKCYYRFNREFDASLMMNQLQ